MNTLIQPSHLSLQEVFASTLIHSLWQGAIIVLVMWCLRLVLPKTTKLNYVLSLFALTGLVLTSFITFLVLWNQNTIGYYPFAILSQLLDNQDVLKWFTIIWMLGSILFFLRFLLSHFYLSKLISNSKPIINNQWIEIFNSLKNYYSIQKSIVLLKSEKVSSAFLTGVIKPVIIIPTSWVNQLTIKEAECILAHELSHVFNKDHWVNLFIHFSEIIFYFNPAVHILISHIKLERELKADSSACQYIKEPMLYAKLILKIEESASFVPALTLPFFQQKRQLKRRIESVLNINSSKNEFTSGIALFAITLSLLFFGSVSIKEHSINYSSADFNSITCKLVPLKVDVPMKIEYLSNRIPDKKNLKQINKIHTSRLQENKIISIKKEESKSDENDDEIVAFDDSHQSDILLQIEKDIKAEKNNRSTIIYEISKTGVDSNESINGGNWVVPRQIKYYAPVETKTYIIIKSQNASPSFESESDWNIPGHLKIRTLDKH